MELSSKERNIYCCFISYRVHLYIKCILFRLYFIISNLTSNSKRLLVLTFQPNIFVWLFNPQSSWGKILRLVQVVTGGGYEWTDDLLNMICLCWCYVLRWIWCWWCYSECISTQGKLEKYLSSRAYFSSLPLCGYTVRVTRLVKRYLTVIYPRFIQKDKTRIWFKKTFSSFYKRV